MLNMSNPFSPLGSTAPISVTNSSSNTALGADTTGQAVYIANSGPAMRGNNCGQTTHHQADCAL